MNVKHLRETPLSDLLNWVREHEKLLLAGLIWGLAAVFGVIAVVNLWKSLL